MVGITLYLLPCPLIPFCEDDERVRAIVTRLIGELLCEMESCTRFTFYQSPM